MDDLTGLGKIADSQLTKDLYKDALSGGAKQLGATLEETLKAFRLFCFPIQLLAVAQDRLSRFCERVRNSVPEEQHIEAAPSIAGPILMELRFMEDDNPLTGLYLNLLCRAIDRERKDEAHPAFMKIIGQLSPVEALLLHRLGQGPFAVYFRFDDVRWGWNSETVVDSEFQLDTLEQLAMSLGRLKLLGLLDYDTHNEINENADAIKGIVELTLFGKLFVRACNP